MKRLIIITCIVLTASARGYGQIDIGALLNAGIKDANVLAQPYLQPYGEILGSSLNSGWYTSAKPHKMLGFDITLTGTYTMAPSSATTFDISSFSDQLQTYELLDPNHSITPTVAGDMDNRPVLKPKGVPGGTEADFTMPNGSGMDYLVTPMVTVGVGLPMGFEVKGRFAPEIEIGSAGKFGLWGLGVQKDVKEYIPGVKHVPVLNMSVLVGYTSFKGTADVGTVPDLLENGSLDLAASAYTTRLLIGANLPVVAFYGGLGYGHSSSDFDVLGDYFGDTNGEHIQVSYATNTFDMNVGMRIRLGVFALHADYTLGEYNAVTAGVGISFR
ncbi:DUF6588 family protein [Labilibacter marinus]|uniref:DUF6588 family protein n=1 Tax=Labilibacter marinus TaxID=1477105 RepID=UPI001E4AB1CC|nr:DUF6588 family protein [Labilibacter marinus]